MCTPAFYGRVSLQNRNPTKKKDGFPGSKYSPGGAPDPEKNAKIQKRRKIKKRRQKLDLKVLLFANPHSPPPTPQALN